MTKKTKLYQGLLSLHGWGDASNVLFLSSLHDPLAEELSWMQCSTVSVRYWITDQSCTKDEAIEANVMTLLGFTDVKLHSRYSDLTGYLWTDEDLMVGGHDLLAELKSNVGKWLILEIEVTR